MFYYLIGLNSFGLISLIPTNCLVHSKNRKRHLILKMLQLIYTFCSAGCTYMIVQFLDGMLKLYKEVSELEADTSTDNSTAIFQCYTVLSFYVYLIASFVITQTLSVIFLFLTSIFGVKIKILEDDKKDMN